MDFQRELTEMRKSFERTRRLLLPTPPKWLDKNDGLISVYEDREILRSKGSVYYAYIIQANTSLFETNTVNIAPASIIYNLSITTEINPNALRPFGRYLYLCKEKPSEDVPEWLGRAVEILKDGMDRSALEIRVSETERFDMDMKFLPVIVFAAQLPLYRLCGNIIPIVAAPEHCNSAVVLNGAYWSREFKNAWVQKEL